MIESFWHKKVDLGVVLLILLVIIAGCGAAFFYLREAVYNYNLVIPGGGESKINLQYGSWSDLQDVNFYSDVRKKFIDNKITFIDADLSTMQLRVYKNGSPKLDVPILTKGREGSWWETPAGLYKIESKEKNHFSSFGQVYMPWSLQFQGNFFIHGWPYYSGGEPVSSKYSGGCIRIGTDDAEQVFKEVSVGTPVLVFESNLDNGDSFAYEKKLPDMSAKSFLAADLKNNFVFIKKDETAVMPIASITKLMTAIVTTEYVNLENNMTIDKSMIVKTSKPRLWSGETISAYQLLFPLLLESSNEAAVALSNFLGPNRFVDLMNKKAESLGMANTTFADPAGKGEENVSTASDLFKLAKNLYENRSFILKITTNKVGVSAYGAPPFSNLKNFNGFENDERFVGGKIGLTEAAGETMLAIFEIPVKNEKRPIAIVVIDSQDNFGDIEKILEYVQNNFF